MFFGRVQGPCALSSPRHRSHPNPLAFRVCRNWGSRRRALCSINDNKAMTALITVRGTHIRIRGGPLRIGKLEAEKYQFIYDPPAMIEALKTCGTRIDLFTFLQRLPETSPKYSYPFVFDNLAVIPLTTFEHWWHEQIGNKTRNMIRHAERKGVVLREVAFDDSLVKGIWEVYNECPVRQGVPFRHYGKDLTTVHREEATFLESSTFIGAFVGETMVGFVKLVYDETGSQAGLMNIISMIRHRDKAPTNALIAHAIKTCVQRGVRYLVYSNFAYGKSKGKNGITDFKRNNGFVKVEVPRYYVPLTSLGWLGYRLGAHRTLVEIIPDSIASRLRRLRGAWYSRKNVAAESTL